MQAGTLILLQATSVHPGTQIFRRPISAFVILQGSLRGSVGV